jgi:predicted O-methyltransferase YrrM
MRSVNISTRLLSEAAWRRILETSAPRLVDRKQAFFERMASLEELRETAEYNTGSISAVDAWALYSVASFFRPARILEVGTFIGKSTLSLAMGMDDARVRDGEIHTCDLSNEIQLPEVTSTRIVQYPKSKSTEMFEALAKRGAHPGGFDLVYLDGRLRKPDFRLLQRLCIAEPIVALDDFEGYEKGVANLAGMRAAEFLPDHLLIYPPGERLRRDFGFTDNSTTALMIPRSAIRLTAQ